MGTSTLVVEVVDTERGLRQEFRFSRSPVRLGRSALNDLPLDRNFVSSCHGVLQFDGQQCEFVDLGSTNGSLIDGAKVHRNVPMVLAGESVVAIGALELRCRQIALDMRETHSSYALRGNALGGAASSYAADAAPIAPAARPAPAPLAAAQELARAVDALSPAVSAYRAAWSVVRCTLDAAPPTTPRSAIAAELLKRCPELAHEVEFRCWAGLEPEPASVGLAGAHTGSAARSALLLENFAKAFLELRRGQRQFVRDLSLAEGERSPLSERDDAPSLLGYLLDPGAPAERLDELSRAYAEIMLHQVALLNGVAAGARELLNQLSPTDIARHEGGVLRAVLRAFGRDGRWRLLRRRFEDLEEDTALTRVLLGRAFARAYAACMGQKSGSQILPSMQENE